MARDGYIEVKEADLKEFIEAAKEAKEEGAFAEMPGSAGMVPGDTFNALHHATEDRFERALSALEFDLAEVSRG